MKYPSTIILFMHGTHGNFLKTFWQLHNNIKIKPINDKGESFTDMDWWYNLENHKVLDNAEDFEILHIWHEYMTKWPSKFYYIDFKENICELIEDSFASASSDFSLSFLTKFFASLILLSKPSESVINSFSSLTKFKKFF